MRCITVANFSHITVIDERITALHTFYKDLQIQGENSSNVAFHAHFAPMT